MKINYVIATWNGIRVKPIQNVNYYEQVLKNHLNILNGFSNSISQITIMKPNSAIRNTYYDIELSDKVKTIDCENKYFSYGQWLTAINVFLNDFDYFIFIEDDYVPATNDFDMKLINIYKDGTYLCSLAGEDKQAGLPYHCRISNGLISTNTIRNHLTNVNHESWFTKNGNHQISFSKYLEDNGIRIVDYATKYIVDYFALGVITNYGSPIVENKVKIFTPIQNIVK